MLLSLLGKSVAAKVAVGFATVSLSGVSVAAATGSLPDPVQQVAYDVAGGAGVPAPDPDPVTPSVEPSSEAPAESSPPPSEVPGEEPGADDPASPSPSAPDPSDPSSGAPSSEGPDAGGPAAKGLCEAYRRGGAKAGGSQERALAGAAGGVDRIGAYCDTVLADRDERRASHSPKAHTGAPTARPAKTRNPEPTVAGKPEPTRAGKPAPTRAGKPEPTRAGKPEPTRAGKPEPTRTKGSQPSKH